MRLKLVTPPSEEPVQVHEVIDNFGLDDPDCAYISRLIKTAREQVELGQRRALLPTTFELYLDAFPRCNRPIELPRPPLSSVSFIKYLDTDGTQQTLSPSDCIVDDVSEPGRVVPANGSQWPTTYQQVNAVVIRYVAGYESADLIPESSKSAIQALALHLFENREPVVVGASVVEVPMHVEMLILQNAILETD